MSHSEDIRYRAPSAQDVVTAFEQVRRELRADLGEKEYLSYIEHLACLGLWDGALIVLADNTVLQDWVRRRAQHRIEGRLATYGVNEPVKVLVEAELPARLREALGPAAVSVTRETASAATSATTSAATGGMPRAPARISPDMSFETFCVSDSNYRAHAVCQMVASGAGMPFPVVLIHGQPGLGKTHLLHAVAIHIMETQPHRRVNLMMAQEFVEEFQAALHKRKDPAAFKAWVRDVDFLLIDDVQRLAGKRATEEEFVDTLAFLRARTRGQVIMTADHGPDGLSGFDERLRQQIKAATVCEITEPDPALRLAILKQRVAHYQRLSPGFAVQDAALEMIAERITESGRMLDGALAQLVVESSIVRGEVTLEVAENALRAKLLEQAPAHRITVAHIQKVVAGYYNMSVADLLKRTRSRSIARPRQIAMHLACLYTTASLPEIGRRFGSADNPFDHTTVMYARDVVPELAQKESKVRQDLEALTRLIKRAP